MRPAVYFNSPANGYRAKPYKSQHSLVQRHSSGGSPIMASVIILLLLAAVVFFAIVFNVPPTSHGNTLVQQHHSNLPEELRSVASLGCHRRLVTYQITQTDSGGRMCTDFVNAWSCWGRCDSKEIADWKFPFKKSYHPVCVHAGRSNAVADLRQCDPGVEPETRRYEYTEATGCHCQVIARC